MFEPILFYMLTQFIFTFYFIINPNDGILVIKSWLVKAITILLKAYLSKM